MFKPSTSSSIPAHLSKDFVEHLRTVQFALILVSASLVLVVSFIKVLQCGNCV
ncbi:MAG: hypothetical protein JWQ87_4804 [Candidatus Sulfotelmatobacter sp.]|nr:hypothetical protein [Candidatus Sulfotelmatobacter sp.]